MKARFEIGQNERHIIEVYASIWTAGVKITLDGIDVTKTYQIGLSDKSYRFSVGDKEKHDVEVRVGGLITAHVEIIVDGRLIGTA